MCVLTTICECLGVCKPNKVSSDSSMMMLVNQFILNVSPMTKSVGLYMHVLFIYCFFSVVDFIFYHSARSTNGEKNGTSNETSSYSSCCPDSVRHQMNYFLYVD